MNYRNIIEHIHNWSETMNIYKHVDDVWKQVPRRFVTTQTRNVSGRQVSAVYVLYEMLRALLVCLLC
jgi:hypothetical protein